MKSSLVPKLSDFVPIIGGDKYLDRCIKNYDLLKAEGAKLKEVSHYGMKALAVTGVLWVYNVALLEGALIVGLSGLAKLLEK
jgi:hypothetical protein